MSVSPTSDEERNQLTRYQILRQHMEFLHRLFWSRVQILHLIQAGVLAGSFYVRGQYPALSFGLLGLGVTLTIILRIICRYDWNDVEENKKSLYPLGDSLGIRWSSDQRFCVCGHKIYGHKIFLNVVFPLFIVVDAGLLAYFIYLHTHRC